MCESEEGEGALCSFRLHGVCIQVIFDKLKYGVMKIVLLLFILHPRQAATRLGRVDVCKCMVEGTLLPKQ
jgi:hypothetical protein